MKFKKLHLISGLLIAGLGISLLSSYSSGITSQHTVGCGGGGCHGAQSAGTIIALTGIPVSGWVPSTSYPLTLTVTNTAKVAAGFNFLFSAGTLTAGTGMALSGLEMRHTSPKTMVSGTSTWTFNWTAPASGTSITVNIAGNAVNLNGFADANDNWNTAVLTFNAASTATAPTATTTAATGVTATTATLTGTINANGASTAVSFEYGTTVAYGSTVTGAPATATGTTSTSITGAVSGLAPATLYHYRIKGVNSVGTGNGADLTFTTAAATAAPTATTLPATAITTTTATLNGSINANNASTTISFEYGTTVAYGTTATATPATATGATATLASSALSGLAPGTLYHYRIKGVNSVGTTNGNDLTFTTAAAATAPTATTLAANVITTVSAQLNGSVNANSSSTTVTFEYGTTTTYGTTVNATPNTVTGSTITFVNAPITGLTPSTLYHYRIIAVNGIGTTNGNDLTFTTAAITAPTVNTTGATGITATGGTLNGSVNANGSTATVTFEYGTTTAYGSTINATPGTIVTNGSISAVLTGLLPGTLYHYRAVAVNSIGTTNGGDRTFTTTIQPVAPNAVTLAATAITGSGATLNGSVTAGNSGTSVSFRYGTTPAYGTSVNATPGTVTGNTATNVSANISGLASSTLYHYRVFVTNALGTDSGADLTFTTGIVVIAPPTLTVGATTGLNNNGATVNGTVNANGTATTITVEYGQSLIYGLTRNVTPNNISTNAVTPISAVLTGLLPNKVYHFRFKAVNAGGTVYSSDATFSTTNLSIGSFSEGGLGIYPNPAQQQLILTVKSGAKISVAATAVNGSVIALAAQEIAAGQYAINTAELAPGTYLLLVNSDGKTYTTRFVKQ